MALMQQVKVGSSLSWCSSVLVNWPQCDGGCSESSGAQGLAQLIPGWCPLWSQVFFQQDRVEWGSGRKEGTQSTLKAAGCWAPFHMETDIHSRGFCLLFPLSVQLQAPGKDLGRVNALLRQWHWSLRGTVWGYGSGCPEGRGRGCPLLIVRFVSAQFSWHFSDSSCQLLFSPTAGLVASL